jgi:hypothetical protein
MLKCTWQSSICTGVLFQECLAPWVLLPMRRAFGKFCYCICGGYFIWSISLLEKRRRNDLKPTIWNWEGFLFLPLLRSRLKILPPSVLHDLCLFWTVITFTWYFMTGTKPTGVGVGVRVGTFPKSTTTLLKPPSLIALCPLFWECALQGGFTQIS